jgi:hypothetical protein
MGYASDLRHLPRTGVHACNLKPAQETPMATQHWEWEPPVADGELIDKPEELSDGQHERDDLQEELLGQMIRLQSEDAWEQAELTQDEREGLEGYNQSS